MFCENCGNKLKDDHKFCTKCGHSSVSEVKEEKSVTISDEKWWVRLAKVVYVGLYVFLPFLLIIVWDENSYYPEDAFWATLITFVVYIVLARLAKITFLYISFAQKPQWKREFKKFF